MKRFVFLFASAALAAAQTPEQLAELLKRFPAADANKDGTLTVEEARAFRERNAARSQAPAPTHANVSYGPHERNVLDFWQAKTDAPAPVLVFIHGGGFVAGDKRAVPAGDITRCLASGISVASINYRYTTQAPYPAPMLDSARAVQFIRSKADAWHVDPKRMAAYGGSAGAGISMWLAFHDDLAKPESADPVESQSTRLTCAGSIGGQSSYDPLQIKEWLGGRAWEHSAFLPFYGVQSRDEFDKPEVRKLAAAASVINHLTKDDAPVFFLYAESDEPLSADSKPGDGIHHPKFAHILREKMTALGIESAYRHSTDRQQPHGHAAMLTFFEKQLLAPEKKLNVSANGRHLTDRNGRPFFYLGDTCWLLFQRLNREEVDDYLKDRAAKGFTVIQAYVLRGLGEGKNSDSLNGRNRDGEVALIDRDPTRLNEGFFKNVDYVINRANELGLVMALVTSKSWHVNEHPERVFDVTNAYTFGKLLGERYRNHAVLWYVGGDSPPGRDGDIWEAMAKGHKDGSGGRHLVSFHGSGSTSSSQWFHQAPWLDFNSIQSGHGWAARTDQWVTKDYALKPTKPVIDMEPPYENHPTGKGNPRIDSHQVRKGAYWAMLAGAAGHGYGAIDLFHLYGDNDGPFPRDGGYGPVQHWRKAMAYEGSRQVGFMRRLFEQRPWHKLVPDQAVIASGEREGEEHAQAARADDGSFAIVYLPQGLPLRIKTDRITGPQVKARWFNPREGSWIDRGEFPMANALEFTAPSQGPKEDWVLVLDDPAKNYPAN